MAFLEFKNVRIAGFSAGVPKKTINNLDLKNLSKDYDAAAFVETTGVKERRVDDFTTSDLCIVAAEQLIKDLNWNKSEIEAIIFVSQTRDYLVPATSCIIQDKLGLSIECYAIDIELGCSGWVYGLSSVVSLMTLGGIKKALLMAGDAKRAVDDEDPLFGYAGTVTALEYNEGDKGFQFHFGTDGSGYDAILVPDGGSRNQMSSESFVKEEIEGRMYNRLQARMKGMDVFSFGISTAPKSVRKLADNFGFDYLDYDYFVFHQANMKMNNMISKKLKLDLKKVPSSMYKFGNTSSASIPITIVTELQGKFEDKPTKFICCGFGVGLSWGTVAFETKDIVISDLVEI
jgi:3-oxoacyl-[acyl-carrier-protein] synthase-3